MVCAHAGSYENIMQAMARPAFGLQLTAAYGSAMDVSDVKKLRTLRISREGPRLERAIGGIYRPATARTSHYFQTCASFCGPALCRLLRCRAFKDNVSKKSMPLTLSVKRETSVEVATGPEHEIREG